ncbi:MAG: MBOAT family protein [Leptospiraceae bacterium]|nr:MBOAT family protein [Leptospiraceae bacterium]MCK6381353.1 MBOAT family protein [Leptospiraceae bacterium]NUM41521.1 MBOAT family protein [Leptospiraceae bacterium]
MLFNSLHFLIFFPLVIILTHFLKKKEGLLRIFLLIASLYFYMVWNVYFIFLLLLSIVIDYFIAIEIQKSENEIKRKILLVASLFANLGLLCYFKYTNFLLGAFNDLNFFNSFRFPLYSIILPVGISFYTFQSMSYSIDVYRRQIEARKSFIDFALYVSFFPQLVAGPIVRAQTFFRDLDNRLPVKMEDIKISFARILLGFTKKIVFADNMAIQVDLVFKNYSEFSSIEIWTGSLLFAWQIYYDFAGYTDIAIGVARLFGFQFDKNFHFPYAASNINDYWAKWHISFITWIRDYIFIPLGGSRGSKLMVYRNILITFLFAGIWHGASYHFVLWGVWNGVFVSIHREYSKTKVREFLVTKGGAVYEWFCRLLLIFFLGVSAIFFRAEDMTKGWEMLHRMFAMSDNVSFAGRYQNSNFAILLFICYFAGIYFSKRPLETLVKKPVALTLFLIANFLMLLAFGITESQSFIYFAF